MMYSLVFDSSEPLFGRADEILKIEVEFDVVALSEDNNTLLVGECKWSDIEFIFEAE